MSARDIILEACKTFDLEQGEISSRFPDHVLQALISSGYRILAPGEMDRETLEKVEKAICIANETVMCLETPAMKGDNLAVSLCSYFDDGSYTEDDTGWSDAARKGYEDVKTVISAHYAAAIRALGGDHG